MREREGEEPHSLGPLATLGQAGDVAASGKQAQLGAGNAAIGLCLRAGAALC